MELEVKYSVTDVSDGYPLFTRDYTEVAEFIDGELVISLDRVDERITIVIPKEDLLKLMEAGDEG
jgi:hypothetical protein